MPANQENLTQNISIELDEFNAYSFTSQDMIEDVKHIIEEAKQHKIMIEGDIDSNTWKFISKSRYVSVVFKFNELEEHLLFLGIKENSVINSLKCWIMTNLFNRSIESLRKYYDYIKEFILLTRGFDEKHLDATRLFLQYECNDSKRWNLCIPILNYLDFYENIDKNNEYRKMLVDLKKEIDIEKVSGKVRSLPTPQDILSFSWVLEDYMSKVDVEDKHYFQYYPLYIWWVLSNKIPMRPSEFCGISRNSLSKGNDRFYIKLPRIKQKNNSHKIQIIDTFAIPKEIYQKIERYIDLTHQFGTSVTLISPKSFKRTVLSSYKEDRFTYTDLQYLLNRFYDEIVDILYNLKYKDRISPGDTRHFAFLNLMRLAYHPVEIARLGGHTSLQAQYHYQQHMEYWVDVEIVQMMYRLNLGQNKEKKEDTDSNFGVCNKLSLIDEEFLYEKVLKPNNSDFKEKLAIGYCTDPNMYCQTEKCFFCDYWRISEEEYLEKKIIIEREQQNCNNEIPRLITTMNNLYKIALKEGLSEEDVSEFSLSFNQDLHYTKKELDSALHKAVNFASKLNFKKGSDYDDR
ncbi:Phage integrase family protein [Bacillus sp. ok061]|uniref:site-specific integrase n=1 Tax=Bacillus sp. ok061 TaxID=1761766 RepID=UPI00089E44E7|nr:site-specific integrase [Bacillus sp. ok061]SEG01473.1 Phage integrase family protein [Bacillus sp. ok061]